MSVLSRQDGFQVMGRGLRESTVGSLPAVMEKYFVARVSMPPGNRVMREERRTNHRWIRHQEKRITSPVRGRQKG